MSNNPRWIDLAVDDAMDTHEAAVRLVRLVDDASADGVISLTEMRQIRVQTFVVKREADEVVTATERANVAELVVLAHLKRGGIGPRLLKQARDVDMDVMTCSAPVLALSPNYPRTAEIDLDTA